MISLDQDRFLRIKDLANIPAKSPTEHVYKSGIKEVDQEI